MTSKSDERSSSEAVAQKEPWAAYPLPRKDQQVRIAVRAPARDGYRCVDMAHTQRPVLHAADKFTQEQLWKLSRDRFIVMDYVDAPKPAKDEAKKS